MSMFNLGLLQVYSAMARHAADSQRVSAANIAHADEPGYKASEMESFQDFVQRTRTENSPDAFTQAFHITEADTPASPDGNSVDLEREVFKSAEAAGQHELAVSVYTKSLDLLRAAIGKKY